MLNEIIQARHLEKECLVSGEHWTDVSCVIEANAHGVPETGARWAGERSRGGRVCLPLDWTESWLCCFLDRSDGKESAYKTGDLDSIPWSGRSPGEGNGNPLQHPCLVNRCGCRRLGLQSIVSQSVGHAWVTDSFTLCCMRQAGHLTPLKLTDKRWRPCLLGSPKAPKVNNRYPGGVISAPESRCCAGIRLYLTFTGTTLPLVR